MTGLSQGAAFPRLRAMLAWTGRGEAAPSSRGAAFWIITILLGLLLPTPIALAVIVARLRRGGAGTRRSTPARGGPGSAVAASAGVGRLLPDWRRRGGAVRARGRACAS